MLNDILEIQFVLSLKCNIPPDDNMDFFTVYWFYERYIAHKQETDPVSVAGNNLSQMMTG